MSADTTLKDLSYDELLVVKKLLQVRDTRVRFATKCHLNSKGEPMEFENDHHIWPLYNTLAPRVAVEGSVQSMKSEWLIVDHIAMAACGLSVFFVLPKVETRTTYVQNRINARLGESQEYRALMAGGSFDNTMIKSFRGYGTVRYVGANARSDMREFPADAVVVEETQECNPENLMYACDRMEHSKYKFERYVGNPTTRGRGINYYFAQSNQQLWHVVCDKCHEPISLDFFNVVIGQKFDDNGLPVDYWLLDEDWKPNCGRDVYCMCPNCAVPLDRANTQKGLWIPQKPEILTFDGYRLSKLMTSRSSVLTNFENFETAWDDAGKMEWFYTSCCGKPFAAEDSKLTVFLLQKAAMRDEPYTLVLHGETAHVPNDCHHGVCTMGIDQGKRFDVRVSEALPGNRRKMVFCGKINTLNELINVGIRYNVQVAVIDSMPEYHVVENFKEQAPFFVWSCRYDGEGTDHRMKRDKAAHQVRIDRTLALDKALSDIKSGKNLIPTNFRAIIKEKYVEEMTISVRQEETLKGGETRFIWTKGIDHQRHADVYDMLARLLLPVGGKDALSGVFVG